MLVPHVMTRQRSDISLLIGQASSKAEINDLRRDVELLYPRYTITITLEWVQDSHPSNDYWSCRTLADSAILGDVCAARWWVYGANGIASGSFRLRLMEHDTHVLR